MIVVDANVLVVALADDANAGEQLRDRLRPEVLLAPGLIDLEVLSVLRRHVRAGLLGTDRAAQAVTDLGATPVGRIDHRPLIGRIWELRENLTAYDAAYVAVAELFGIGLLTADAALASAPGPRCAIELVEPA